MKTRILIAIDNLELTRRVSAACMEAGFSIATVKRGREVLGMVRSFSPDLLVLDLELEPEERVAVCNLLRREDPQSPMPVPIVTGLTEHLSRYLGINLGKRARRSPLAGQLPFGGDLGTRLSGLRDVRRNHAV